MNDKETMPPEAQDKKLYSKLVIEAGSETGWVVTTIPLEYGVQGIMLGAFSHKSDLLTFLANKLIDNSIDERIISEVAEGHTTNQSLQIDDKFVKEAKQPLPKAALKMNDGLEDGR